MLGIKVLAAAKALELEIRCTAGRCRATLQVHQASRWRKSSCQPAQPPCSHLRVVAVLRVGQHLANVLCQRDGAAAKLPARTLGRALHELGRDKGAGEQAGRHKTGRQQRKCRPEGVQIAEHKPGSSGHTWMMVRRWRPSAVSGSLTTPAAAACAASTSGSWLCGAGLIRPERSTEMMCSCSCCVSGGWAACCCCSAGPAAAASDAP